MRQSLTMGRMFRCAAVLICLAPIGLQSARSGTDARAQSPALHFPDLQVHGESAVMTQAFSPEAPDSQEGFGDSLVVLQSLDERDGNVEIVVTDKTSGDEAARLERSVGAGSTTGIDLSRVSGIGFGDFAASLLGDVRFGAVARTRWPNGATTAYRSPETSTDLVLPLLVANVLGQSTVFSVQNSSADNTNPIDVMIFDSEDGGLLQTINETLDPSQTASWDTFLDRSLFTPPNLPANAHGGYVGSLRIKAYEPVAALAYGDQDEGKGSSAYAARPASAASPQQYLPLVRAGLGGDSLIGIANVDSRAVDVTIEYRAASFEPGGSDAVTTQTFKIDQRGTAIVDLSERGRGNRPAPALGRFAGSATIRATGPVLAASIEDRRVAGQVDAIAAYNAFGPADLGTKLAVPLIRRATEFATTAFAVFNPGPGSAHVEIDLLNADDRSVDRPALDVEAGDVAWLGLGEVPAFAVGTGRAVAVASRPVAMLAYEERDTSVQPKPQPVSFNLVEIMDSGVSGRVKMTQVGNTVDVDLRLEGMDSASLSLNEGACSLTPGRELHALEPAVGGYSSTQLSPAQLAELADGAHSIRAYTEGPRGRWNRACGIIPYVAGATDADLSVVEALVMELVEAPPVETPTTPPTVAPPSATSTPVGPEPTDPPPSPTVTDYPKARIYLPLTRRGD